MAVVQGLTHFTYISLGKTLQELDFDIKKSRNFSSPIYELMLDMVGRIIGQDPRLYAEIQMQNPKVPGVHEKFIETARKLSESVKKGDEAAFVSAMADAARHFDDVDRAMGRSDKAIASLVSELENLKNSVGKEICLQHIYSGKKHLGVVEEVKPDEVVISDGGKRFNFKLSNVRVLGWKDRLSFKREKYGEVSRDYSAVFSESVSEEFIARLLTEHDENITKVAVKDVFRGPKVGEGRKSICFGVSMVNDSLRERDVRVREFIQKIGGTLR
jgi:prephenate dehydrogenase